MKTRRNRLIVIGIIGIYIIFKFINYTWFAKNPGSTEKISFIVRQGESVRQIAKKLEEKEIIQSDWAFYWHARKNGIATNIKAGRFILSPGMTAGQIALRLTETENAEGVVTIPEGFSIKQIDVLLAEQGLIEAGELLSCMYFECMEGTDIPNYMNGRGTSLEGFLFPDTYFVDTVNFSLPQFINRLIANFEKKIINTGNLQAVGDRTLYEIVTMASMIEKEVKIDADRQMVADILWRRLDGGWMLGVDATLLYEKDNLKITGQDLQDDSPYNTRKHKGLPPTPISNPGLASIEAALYPKPNRYWFYLTKPKTGEAVYAYSNEEHNENRAKYLH